MKSWFTVIILGLALSLAACGGGSQSALLTGSVGVVCPAIAIQSPALAYPAPNATNVPISAGVLVFYSYGNPLVIPIDVQLSANGATAVDLGNMQPLAVPIPTPTAAPPTPAAANMGSVNLPTLARGVTYSVTVQSPSGACPLIGTAILGTFTTSSS